MPKINDAIKSEKVELPSYPGSSVEIETITAGKMLEVEKEASGGDLSDTQRGVFVLFKAINSWNFTDENNQPLPLTMENFNKLPIKDFEFLSEKIMPQSKKNYLKQK